MGLIKRLSEGFARVPLAITLASTLALAAFLPREANAERVEASIGTYTAPALKRGDPEVKVLTVQRYCLLNVR